MLPWFTKYPHQNDEILNLDWVIRQVENLKEAYEAFLAANSLTFADPITWNITKQYSKNTIVLSPEGDAYLSKKVVGKGVQLNNTDYWLEIFNFAEYVRTANSNLTVHIELNTTRATAAYAVNDWLLWEDVLYKVTAAISPDDLLVVDTNIVHFTVEDFCRTWQTYMVNTIAQYKAEIDASELAYKQQLDGTVLQYKNDIDASELAFTNQIQTYVNTTTGNLQAQLDAAIAGVTVDSEVINARIGADGYTYTTLGDAIRTQISRLNNLTYVISHCDNMFTLDMTGAVTGSRFNASDGTLITDGNFEYKIFPYVGGAVLVDRNTSASGNGAVIFFGENMTFISGVAWQIPTVLTMPSGCKYIGISTVITDASSVSVTQSVRNNELSNGIKFLGVFDKNRNGTKGNPANPNAITINDNGYIECKSRYIQFNFPYSLQSGYKYRIVYYLSNNTSFSPQVSKPIIYTDDSSVIIDTEGYKYIDISVSRVLATDPEGTYDALRVESAGYYVFNAIYIYDYEEKAKNNLELIKDINTKIVTPTTVNGSIGNPGNTNVVSTRDIIPLNGAKSLSIYLNGDGTNTYYVTIDTYSVSSGVARNNSAYILHHDADELVVNNKYVYHFNQFRDNEVGIAFGIKKVDSSNNLVPIRAGDSDAYVAVSYDYNNWNNYIIDEHCLKTPVNVRHYGYIPRPQDFIIDNGYIYSIDSTGISKSALSDPFTVITSNSIEAGHANTLQLAADGYAYASGWDDSTLYKIDLSDLSIVDTITLPITGYFSGVFDAMRGLVYIFHQNTLSDGYYQFSIYDVTTEEIISTQATIQFSNIQGMDYFDNRILVMAGLAEPTSPNKMFIFDTSGNVICNYVLNSLTYEYEGICLDRSDYTLYISDIGQDLRIVESIQY